MSTLCRVFFFVQSFRAPCFKAFAHPVSKLSRISVLNLNDTANLQTFEIITRTSHFGSWFMVQCSMVNVQRSKRTKKRAADLRRPAAPPKKIKVIKTSMYIYNGKKP